jgi:hypothetical protein
MNKTITVILIFGGIILVAIGTLFAANIFFKSPGPSPSDIATNTSSGSNATNTSTHTTSTSGRIALETWDGATVSAKDIKIDPETTKDSYNVGHYFVGYPPPGSVQDPNSITKPPYSIQYIDKTQFFSISLLQQPISESRKLAEQYLEAHLGLKAGDMCRLKYTVSVANSVDQTFAGRSLGFSFCNGAVQLP